MASSKPTFSVRFPAGSVTSVTIDKDLFTIGRRADCDLVIAEKDISRIQAEIVAREDGYHFEDKNSRFGTWINGSKTASHLLKNRDVITMGEEQQIELVFMHGDRMSQIRDDVDSRQPRETSLEDHRNLSLLLEICNALNSTTSLQDLLELALDAVLDATGAERGFLLLKEKNGELQMRVARKLFRKSLDGEDHRISRSIVDRVLASGEPCFLADVRSDAKLSSRRSVVELSLGSIVCLPLRVTLAHRLMRSERAGNPSNLLGIIYADSTHKAGPVSEVKRELLQSIAVQVVGALENFYLRQDDLERRLAEREMEREVERLKTLDRLKSEFLSNVSHELRTPLTSIRGAVDNMLDGLAEELGDRQRGYLVRMRENSAQLNRLITDLLDVGRLEAGRLALERQKISLRGLIEDATESMRPVAERKGIELTMDAPDDGTLIRADRDRLMQVLFNLIGNAVKFVAPGGSILLEASRDNGGDVRISVSDDGAGIREADLERVFERFFQAPGDDGVKSAGTGLGLPIARSLVELHGGRLWAEKIDRGSRFVFTLPAAPKT